MASPTGPLKMHIWQGRNVSLLEMSRITGISDDILAIRIRGGATLEEAIAAGVKPPPKKHEFRGEMLTIEDISRRMGLRPGTIWSRVRCGMTIEEAVSTPKGSQAKRLSDTECKNPNCKRIFLGSASKMYCSRKCCGEVYAMKSGKNEYFDFNGKRLNKFQISKLTGVSVFEINCRVKYFGATVPIAANPEFMINCKYCGIAFKPGKSNKSGFCSVSCSNRYCEEAFDRSYKERVCVGCGKLYKPKSRAQDYCSKNCRHVNLDRKNITADDQYARVSGNWRRYLQRLVNQKGRREDGLTTEILLAIGDSQGWKCSLSGRNMTCELKKGFKNPFNASIDRIIPGGSYSPSNIRLTCSAINIWRSDTDTDVFIELCRSVAEHNPRKDFI